ncbi:glycosyltransferase family 4 protein [Roseomonas frigidaquae]|uniref:Glycosyltransferase family 4 protein n=2 Tax=Falsiroseomonas frigidaquae TaxID=487318 RepID=A0ABX1F767_9PROT|nr:glycosyltransferase family 4 protein [Falsiroseomonas frigidaquae]
MPPAVLQVLPALASGGVERGTIEIAEAIRDAGFRPLVASAGGALVADLERLGVRHVALPLATKSPVGIWRNAAALTALARAEGVRIIHARSRAPAWSALLAARRSGAAFVTTYHGAYNEGLPGKRLYNSVMARGDRVIAISRFIADLVQARHGVPAERIRLIPRGVDPRRFDPALVDAAAIAAQRAAWGAEPGDAVLLLPARLTRWKGQAVLLRALPLLPANTRVVLAGGGRDGYLRELQALAAQLGVAGRLRILGHVPELALALAAADVVVHASTDAEAFGRTVIEAQAMARPVIAADLGGPRETVDHGVIGWRVTPGDPAALAALLAQVLAMPAEARQAVGDAARQAVLARYSTAAMQAATLAVYREFLA